MRKILLLTVLTFPLFAQIQPTQCNMSVTFTASGTTPATGTNLFDNTLNNAQCNTWVMTAYATGFTGMTVQLEGAGPAGVFSAVTASGGTTNPCNTITGCVIQSLAMFNQFRINITSTTGSGTIFVRLNGAVGVTAKVGTSGGATGPAGGDLSGTYPNPTVAQVQGGVIPTSATLLGTNGSKQLVSTSTSMGGDLSGTFPNPTVAKVNGTSVPINSAADQIINTTASATGQWTSVPNCTDTAGNHLNYATSTHTLSCGTTSSTPTGNGVTSSTPITTSGGSVTTDQAMMELSLSAGQLNTLNQAFEFVASGVYTLPAAQTPQITFKIKLCTVSGCGSGTVVTLVSIQTTAATASVTNNNWGLRAISLTHTTGATGNLEIHGPVTVDLGALTTTADSVFQDTNTAVSSNIDLTAALFVDFTVAFSSASASNVATQRLGACLPYAASSGGGGTTVTVAAPYITVAGTKYVAASMWPFTAFFSGSFLDAQTFTITAGTNGSTLLGFTTAGTNAWYSVAATTSVEAEFYIGAIPAGSGSPAYGIWVCDNTNGKIYSFEVNNATLLSATWTETSCTGTPSSPSSIVSYPFPNGQSGLWHLKLVKNGGNVLGQASLDAGQTFVTYLTQAAGTLTKGGIDMRSTGSETTQNMNVLSVAVN